MKRIVLFMCLFFISFVSASPSITDVSMNPSSPNLDESILVCANVTDVQDIITVSVNFHSDSPVWDWGFLMEEKNALYCKIIEPDSLDAYVGKNITYRVIAVNGLGETVSTPISSFVYREANVCTDGFCDHGENCSFCPEDCGECPLICGDGICSSEIDENCFSCSDDCGPCVFDSDDESDDEDDKDGEEYYINSCFASWRCSEWSSCIAGVKTRQCYDAHSCGTRLNKPLERMVCGVHDDSIVVKFFDKRTVPAFLLSGSITLLLLNILVVMKKKF